MTTAAELVGRDSELGELYGLLDEVRAGEQRVALVCGDPGIGKTTLIEALVATAADAGVITVWGRCWEGGGAPPFWPWVQVLRACLSHHGDELLARLGADAAAELARLLPERAGSGPPSAPDDTAEGRAGLFEAVAEVLDAATGSGLIVALDDLHAADEGSLQLLRFLARRIDRSPLFLVGSYRVMEVARSTAHQVALGAVARRGTTIRLHGLSAGEVHALLDRAATGTAAARASDVHRLTDGNPFLVYEAARLLGTVGGNGKDQLVALPEEARAVVRTRLEPLPPELRTVLEAAAVIGREFSLAVLAQVCERTTDDVLDALARSAALQVVDEVGLGRWSFKHSLLREELLAQLDAGERSALHRRAAEVLGADRQGDAGSAAAVAHHLVEAGDPRAVDACSAAARWAMDILAFEDAVAWCERGLAALDDAAPAGRRRYDLLAQLGGAFLRAGDVDRAIDAHDRAIKAAQTLGSVELAAESAIRVAQFAFYDPIVIGALDDALCDLPEADSSLRARVLVCFADVLRTSSVDRNVLLDVSRQGLEMARRLGDDETLWVVLTQWHRTARIAISTDEIRAARLAAAREMLHIAERGRAPRRVVQARLARSYDLLRTGEPAEASREADECLRAARDLHEAVLEQEALGIQFDALFFLGQITAAEALVANLGEGEGDAAPRAGLGLAQEVWAGRSANWLLAIRRQQGRFEEAARLAREGIDRWTVSGLDCVRQIQLFAALAELGRTEEAVGLLDEAVGDRPVEETFGMTIPNYGWVSAPRLCCATALAEVYCLLGDRRRAEVLYGRLLPYAGEYDGRTGVCARFLGQVDTLLGRYDEADAHFRLAHVVHERLGARLWAAHARLDHGRMLVQRGDPADRERASELLTTARDEFLAMGLEFFGGRAAELLEKVGAPALDGRDRVRISQEGEYWDFVYAGEAARVRDSKGLRYLARLLRNPGQEVEALELVLGEGGPVAPRPPGPELVRVTSGDAGALLDERAKAAYRRRLEELQSDPRKTAEAQVEIDFLNAQLSAATGLGGRDRKAASDTERARQSVTKAIKNAIARLGEAHPDLGDHLRSTVRTGIYSAYVPGAGSTATPGG